jgi:proline dehydrogenase
MGNLWRLALLTLSRSRTAAALARRAKPPAPLRRYLAGRTAAVAVGVARSLQRQGVGAVLSALGEHVRQADEARAARDLYLQTLGLLTAAGVRPHIAVKPSHLGMQVSPELCLELTGSLCAAAEACGGFVRLDMEGSAWTRATLDLYRALRQRWSAVGIAIQARLRRSPQDLADLDPLRPAVRLVKGAYAEPAAVAWQRPAEVREQLMALIERQLSRGLPTTVGSHDPEVLAFSVERARALGVPQVLDFEMLLGVRPDLRQRLLDAGQRVAVYLPFGEDWLPYALRRWAERPALLALGFGPRQRAGR